MDFILLTLKRVGNYLGWFLEEPEDISVVPSLTSGKISKIEGSYGIIDEMHYFKIDNDICHLNEGDHVLFFRDDLSFATNVIKDTTAVPKEERFLDSEFQGQIQTREGRKFAISPGNVTFDLDCVEAEFVPTIGDWVILKCKEPGAVSKVEPLKHKTEMGYVTFLCEDEGTINDTISFCLDNCEPGYHPAVGDKVLCSIIGSQQKINGWRAVFVCKEKITSLPLELKSFKKICQDQIYFSNGVVIESIESIVLNMEEIENFSVFMVNQSDKSHEFVCLKIFPDDGQISLIHPNNSKFLLEPKQCIEFKFTAESWTLGFSTIQFDWKFSLFCLKTSIEVSTVLINSCIVPKKTHKKGNYRREKRKPIESFHSNRIIMPGERPMKPANFIPVQLPSFSMPEDLLNALNCSRNWPINDQMLHLQSVKPSVKDDLQPESYKNKFHTLLHLEEISHLQQVADLAIERTTFHSLRGFTALNIPVSEKYNILTRGDKVFARETFYGQFPVEDKRIIFEGYIFEASEALLLIKFHQSFYLISHYGKTYDVSFETSRTAIRRKHQAVDVCAKYLGPDWLFPSKITLQEPQVIITGKSLDGGIHNLVNRKQMVPWNTSGSGYGKRNNTRSVSLKYKLRQNKMIHWFNQGLNKEQEMAVTNILEGVCRPLPYVIFGPPGTGKTLTLVEIIMQLAILIPESRILVAAPSNNAVDIISLRLFRLGLKKKDLLRLVSYRYAKEGRLPVLLQEVSGIPGDCKNERDEDIREVDRNAISECKVVTGTLGVLGYLLNFGFPRGHFTHILIDEAGQTTEPEILIPIGLLNKTFGQVVLAGDPLQLGPVVVSLLARKYGLKEGLMQRFLTRFPYVKNRKMFPLTCGYDPRLVTKLLRNYRSLPQLVSLSDSLFYDNELIAMVSETDSPEAELLNSIKSIVPKDEGRPTAYLFHSIIGIEEQEEGSTSHANQHEAMQIALYLMQLYGLKIRPEQVGIITPYLLQVKKIITILDSLKLEVPKIGSVEEFQGQEKDIILLSLVRTEISKNVEFISCSNRMNVAISRAKSLLVVIGNPNIFRFIPNWKYLIDKCQQLNLYIGSK